MAKKKTRFQIPETYTVTRWGRILNERPAKMDYEEYLALRREQTKRLKNRLRGFVVWKSKAVVTTEKGGKVKFFGESWGTATRDRIPMLRFVD